MKKQNYEKPIASFIAFYSERDITENNSIGTIDDYVTDANGTSGNLSLGDTLRPGDD